MSRPLHYAFESYHCPSSIVYDVVSLLLTNGADVNALDHNNNSPLTVALNNSYNDRYCSEDERIVIYNKGIDDGYDAIVLLLDYGANINIVIGGKWTPLLISLHTCSIRISKLLIEHGANVNVSRLRGVTPLYEASRSGYLDLVKLLISKGANPNTKTNGHTPLSIAKYKKHWDIVEYYKSIGIIDL